MITSAGILLIVDKRILFCHPTNSPWNGTYSIPKGLLDEGETHFQAAIRECLEEVGLDVKHLIEDDSESKTIFYFKKNKSDPTLTKPFKQVVYYTVNTTLDKLGLKDYTIPKEQLQIEEVDWAGFLTIEEAEKKALWRYKELLKNI